MLEETFELQSVQDHYGNMYEQIKRAEAERTVAANRLDDAEIAARSNCEFCHLYFFFCTDF